MKTFQSLIALATFGLAVFIANSAAYASTIDLEELGLELGLDVVADVAGVASFIDAGPNSAFTASVTDQTGQFVNVGGFDPFAPSDFALSLTGPNGVILAVGSVLGIDEDRIEILLDVDQDETMFSPLSDILLVTITGATGSDPFGFNEAATLGLGVGISLTLTNVNQIVGAEIPIPAAAPLLFSGLAAVGLFSRRRKTR